MKTSTGIWVGVALILVAGGTWYWLNTRGQAVPTFIIEGQPVTLVDGRAETEAAPGAASKVVTQYFGNVATGDLDGDGAPDLAFLLTQSRGGSGTFYYVVVTLVAADGSYQGTNAVLLGDRIAPQTTEIRDGQLIVNYADRKPGGPMTARPSMGVSKYLKVEGTTLVEIPFALAGERCGGNVTTAPVCATGYHCAPVPGSNLPFGDVGGTCVAN